MISATMASGVVEPGAYSTVVLSRRRFVLADATPGSSSRVSSMRRAQLEQCIPRTAIVVVVVVTSCSPSLFLVLRGEDRAPVHAHGAGVVDPAGGQPPEVHDRVAGDRKRRFEIGLRNHEAPG